MRYACWFLHYAKNGYSIGNGRNPARTSDGNSGHERHRNRGMERVCKNTANTEIRRCAGGWASGLALRVKETPIAASRRDERRGQYLVCVEMRQGAVRIAGAVGALQGPSAKTKAQVKRYVSKPLRVTDQRVRKGHQEPSPPARRRGRSPSTTGQDRCGAKVFSVVPRGDSCAAARVSTRPASLFITHRLKKGLHRSSRCQMINPFGRCCVSDELTISGRQVAMASTNDL